MSPSSISTHIIFLTFYVFRFNFVNHPWHGTDPAKYGVKAASEEASE